MNTLRPHSFATDDDSSPWSPHRCHGHGRTAPTAQLVEIAPEDPTSGAARFCLQSDFAELDRRFDDGFDPDMSIRAEADDEAGATAVRLETNQRLTEAIGLYAPPAIGRSPPSTTRHPHHWFEKGLTGGHDDTRKGPE